MGSCPIDHTPEEVQKKLQSQREFLPTDVYDKSVHLLQQEQAQETLNELFHLLKKYDLAEPQEQEQRNADILQLS
ncbi:group-specific protein [Natribacillus halophilus]|uniref:Group-specific protein n=1 Tax=Natribacillus halophilus TaxID=549003 RepID=A0A1G8MXZ1_9BACI|nr:group-specific protein [Natribacillus halophilus]SDI72878.1 hypothetical protein SAMN04488123_105100 [Natribacillus halophilus]